MWNNLIIVEIIKFYELEFRSDQDCGHAQYNFKMMKLLETLKSTK